MPDAAVDTPLLERMSATLMPELRTYLDRHKRTVMDMVATGGPEAGIAASECYAKSVDGLLSSLFHAARGAMTADGTWQPVSLAAVGSYGRGALALHSDLDVRLLCEGNAEKASPIAEALLYPLWDSGLSIGHQVVNVEDVLELAREDLPTATSLLDWRVIAGKSASSRAMMARSQEGLFGAANIVGFLERLDAQAVRRHDRFGGSVFLLEPDVKHGEGGVRDLDIVHWVARARWGVTNIRELVRLGVLVPREFKTIDAAQNMLFRVRNVLHLNAGRRSDRLSFDQQEQVAEKLGYGSKGPDIERFMSDYYRHAREMARARELIVARAVPPPTRKPTERNLAGGLKTSNDQMSFQDRAALEEDPALALRIYDEAVRRELPILPFARSTIAQAVRSPEFCEKLRASAEASERFVRLATTSKETRFKRGSVLGELHDVGLLLAMVPEFAPVVGRVHHDIYHVYTVDVHSVKAVDKLRALCRGDFGGEHPLACRLAAEVSRPRILFLATLLHDIGKDLGGKNHAERGVELAAVILGRLGLPEEEIAAVQHLVLHHLKMYHVATRRDVDDPKTLEEFCAIVEGSEGLRDLYLLTVADVSTTSPEAFTTWKARMMDDLYRGAQRFLNEGAQDRAEGERAEALRARVRERWTGDAASLDGLLSSMPVRYLYANDAESIVQHAEFVNAAPIGGVSVAILETDDPYVELAVTADDRPGLLAHITAAFAAARLKVVGGQIYSWADGAGRGRALDMFWVRSGQSVEAAHQLLPRIKRDLEALLSGEAKAKDLVKVSQKPDWSRRSAPPVKPRVSVDNRCATSHTVIEVMTRDRVGLLHTLANTLLEEWLIIDLAKINTEGNRVADVFYVTDADGAKVTDPVRIERLESAIHRAISTTEGETS